MTGPVVSDQPRVAVFNILVRCIFGTSLPQRLPIPGLDQPFDRLAETAIATAAGYATKIECAGPCACRKSNPNIWVVQPARRERNRDRDTHEMRQVQRAAKQLLYQGPIRATPPGWGMKSFAARQMLSRWNDPPCSAL